MSWKKVTMGDFLKHRELRFKPSDIKIRDLKRIEKINFSGNIILSEKPSNTDMILVKNGDLVISGINVEKGALAVYNGKEDVTATIHYSSYEFDNDKIDIDFLQYFLKSEEFVRNCKEQVAGGIKTEIKPKHLLPLQVTIPSEITEQRAIVSLLHARLGNISKIKSESTSQLILIANLRQQILQDAIQGKLVPQNPYDEPASELLERIKAEKELLVKHGKIKKEKALPLIKPEDIPFEIPEGWVWCRTRDICLKITDGTHHSPTNISTGEYKYITAKNIKEKGIDLSNVTYVSKSIHKEIYSRCNPEFGDILYIKDGATTGVVTINDLVEPFSLLSSVALLKSSCQVYNKFLLYCMRSPVYYNATRESMFGVAITRVTLDKIQNSLIPVPPLKEQHRIVEKIDQLMQYCNELEATIQQNQKYTQELLHVALKEAFTPEKMVVTE